MTNSPLSRPSRSPPPACLLTQESWTRTRSVPPCRSRGTTLLRTRSRRSALPGQTRPRRSSSWTPTSRELSTGSTVRSPGTSSTRTADRKKEPMTKETPTLEPLDLSAVISSTEPPELKEFKKRVIEVAKQHSSSMHCGEYKSVLRQLGIKEGEDKVKVELETAFGMVFTVETDPTKLHEKTVDEQKKVLLDTLGTLSLTSGNKSVGVMSVSADSVVRMTLVSTATPFANALDTPSGVWLYGGPDGRVRHFFEGVQETENHEFVRRTTGANVN